MCNCTSHKGRVINQFYLNLFLLYEKFNKYFSIEEWVKYFVKYWIFYAIIYQKIIKYFLSKYFYM